MFWLDRSSHSSHTFKFITDSILENPQNLACILVAEIPKIESPRALVLQMVESPDNEEMMVYRRIGLADQSIKLAVTELDHWSSLFKNAKVKTVKII